MRKEKEEKNKDVIEYTQFRTNTKKKPYRITVTLDGKVIDTFATNEDTVVNSLKSAYEQACGWTFTPREELATPQNPVLKVNVPEQPQPKKRGRKPKQK